MNNKMLRNPIIILFVLFFFTGCLFNTKENINKLPDKKFFFTEFQFILPGQTKESAMIFFKKFPVKKIMFMLAQEYNIIIDISDYNEFLKSGDTAVLKPDGSFRISKHTWNKTDKENNRITFIFDQDYFDADILKFQMKIYSKNSNLKLFNTEISTQDYILTNLKKNLGTGENSLKEYEEKNYDNIYPIPGIIESKIDPNKIEVPADSNII